MRVLFFICSTSILIGLVCLIRTLCRKQLSPLVIYMLWLPILIRFLLPVNISLAAPAGAERLLQMPYIWMEEAVKHVTSREYIETADGLDTQGQSGEQQSAETGEDKIANSVSVTGTDILLGVWLSGSVFFGIGAIISNRKLRGYVKGSGKRYIRVGDILPDCDVDLPVIVCDGVSSPCLVGVFRPCILVSGDVMEQPVLLQYSLRHEMIHYKHWDHIWTFLRVLVCIVYWWNPLVWMASSLARQDGELACDAGVIAGLETEKKKEYGTVLLQLSMKNRQPAGSICITMGITAGNKDLKRRIKGIMNETKTKKYVLLPVALVMAVAFLAGCSGKTDGSGIEDSASAGESIEAEEYRCITLDDGGIVIYTTPGEAIFIADENGSRQYVVGEDGKLYGGNGELYEVSDEVPMQSVVVGGAGEIYEY